MLRQRLFFLVFGVIAAVLIPSVSSAQASAKEVPHHFTFAEAKKKMDRIYYGDLMETLRK